MPITDAELQAIATAEKARAQYISVHTDDPGDTGANEATGGSPAYARQAMSSTVTDGAIESPLLTFNLPAGTYPYFGVWTAATGGTFIGGDLLSEVQTLVGQDVVQFTVAITFASEG